MVNNFFRYDDNRSDNFVFNLDLNFFWSRLYEYPFALMFADKDDVCLDLCCGTYHPLKFALADKCKEVYACDLQDLSESHLLSEIYDMFPNQWFDNAILKKIQFSNCNITSLPYSNEMFHKIFCISSLEHMDLETVILGLKEAKRVLKNNGKIILTVDYPSIIPEKLIEIVSDVGLIIDGEFDYSIPENAIWSDYFGAEYKCYSMILKKYKN